MASEGRALSPAPGHCRQFSADPCSRSHGTLHSGVHSSNADLAREPRDGFGVGETQSGSSSCVTGDPPRRGGADGLALPGVSSATQGGPGSGWNG